MTFSSTTPLVCTTSEGTVFMLSAGICTIVASQAGNANYNPAPPVTQTISIAKAQPVLTLSANPGDHPRRRDQRTQHHEQRRHGCDQLRGLGPLYPRGRQCCCRGTPSAAAASRRLQAADANYNAGQSSPVAIDVQAVANIPTLSEWGLLILASTLAVLTGWHLRRRAASVESGRD